MRLTIRISFSTGDNYFHLRLADPHAVMATPPSHVQCRCTQPHFGIQIPRHSLAVLQNQSVKDSGDGLEAEETFKVTRTTKKIIRNYCKQTRVRLNRSHKRSYGMYTPSD